MIDMPPRCTLRMVSTRAWHSASVRPPAISSSSRIFGSVASARASSSRLRCKRPRLPAGWLARSTRPVFTRMSAQRSLISASRLPEPKAAATSRFSKTVSFSKGCGIWNVRPMPAVHRAMGGVRVMSLPENRIAPVSATRLPAIRLNMVDLPAPFGPMMPRASPSLTSKVTASATFSAPKLFDTSCSCRIGISSYLGLTGSRRSFAPAGLPRRTKIGGAGVKPRRAHHSDDRLHLAGGGYVRRRLVVGDDEVVASALLQPPLPSNERCFGDILGGKGRQIIPAPRDATDDRVELCRRDRLGQRFRISRVVRTLEDIDRQFKERVSEADRLGPGSAGRFGEADRELRRALAG